MVAGFLDSHEESGTPLNLVLVRDFSLSHRINSCSPIDPGCGNIW